MKGRGEWAFAEVREAGEMRMNRPKGRRRTMEDEDEDVKKMPAGEQEERAREAG